MLFPAVYSVCFTCLCCAELLLLCLLCWVRFLCCVDLVYCCSRESSSFLTEFFVLGLGCVVLSCYPGDIGLVIILCSYG